MLWFSEANGQNETSDISRIETKMQRTEWKSERAKRANAEMDDKKTHERSQGERIKVL